MILKTMDGVSFEITEKEADDIKQAKLQRNSDCFVRGAMIPTSSIALYPDEMWAQTQNRGRLHDGTRVIRKFGQWRMLSDESVTLDPHYYPEIAHDTVMTESEWTRRGFDQLTAGEEREHAYRLALTQNKKLLT